MAEVEAVSSPPSVEEEILSEASGPVDTDGEHEATDVVEAASEPEPAESVAEDSSAEIDDNGPHEETDPVDMPKENANEASPPATPSKKITAKSSISVKPPAPGKLGGPPTPLVKKIINSGTFGSGTVKPAPTVSKAGSASATAKPTAGAATTLKKTASTSGIPATRQTSTTSAAPKPTSAASKAMPPPPVPTRRQSIAPKTAVPAAKAPTSAATATKAAPNAPGRSNTMSVRPNPRASIASPDAGAASALKSSTTARPRASVSEGVKRVVSASKPATSGASTPRPPSTASMKGRTPGAASISSIREIRDDSQALAELQTKLDGANSIVSLKTETISELQAEVDHLKSALQTAQLGVEEKITALAALEEAKAKAEEELAALRETLEQVRSNSLGDSSKLNAVLLELEESKAATDAQTQLVAKLNDQVQALQAEVEAAKANLDALRASSEAASVTASATSDTEHAALLRAQADFEAIKAETEALRATHSDSLAAAEAKIKQLEEKAAAADALSVQITELKKENEESANKVSELEVEVLELKEEQETSGETHSRTLARLKSLEQELAASAAAVQKALEDLQAKEVEHANYTEETAKAHQEGVDKAAAEYSELQSQLAALQVEFTQAVEANEKAKADAQAFVEKHQGELAEAEKLRQEIETRLQEDVARITADLESQESKYNAKVDAVKAEHDQLLQEAFERAKNEAGEIHSQDLQKLRAESQAAIEQLRSSHQVTIHEIKTEHQGALESQVKALEKQLSTQALELKATQEDLAKAKANAATVSQELDNVKAQLEEARSLVAALDKSDKDEAIAQLNRNLSNLREDHAALTEMFQATRGSLGEMADNHVKELEEAAKGRAEEVTKLRAAHHEEVTALASEKTLLLSRLQDLEGELATVRAALSAVEPATPQKTNGNAHYRSASISREDLQRLHEAHNAKLHDVQAEHDRALRVMREELEIARVKADELQQEVARKAMEIQYLEQDQEENQDQITRLNEDLEHLRNQLKGDA